MGYTHYAYMKRHLNKAAFKAFSEDVAKVLKACDVPLLMEHDKPDTNPVVTDKEIRFNGVGEDGHETFLFLRDNKKDEHHKDALHFEFCKTAQKPYDLPVTAVLTLAVKHFKEAVKVSSDGGAADWQAGIELVNKTLGYRMKAEDVKEGEYDVLSIVELPPPETPIANEKDVKKVFGSLVSA